MSSASPATVRRPASTAPAVHAEGLTKSFGDQRAVAGLDLTVPAGQVYGLLGPNGAGKTTTVRMLATLLAPDAGRASVLGLDVVEHAHEVRARISLTGQFAALDDDLTATENLVVVARLLGHRPEAARRRAADLLAAFGLAEAADRQVKTFSGGMRRRLDIAASLVVRPELLFLDEPTTGLDPAGRAQVWDLIRGLAAGGTTVLLTTQYLEEADQLADRIAVIGGGTLLAEGTPGELKEATGSGTLQVRLADPGRRAEAVRVLAGRLDRPASQVTSGADPAELTVAGVAAPEAAAAVSALVAADLHPASFALGQPSLDEVFLALTGHRPDPAGAARAAESTESTEAAAPASPNDQAGASDV
jgi:ABC-2 type transport system ATP-binding protein